ncbi:MAG: hypothetical protein Q9M91_01025 [Candidatus Dojkabacteria bacterium]|nr:hypothetical protein [Candidatus Dojkabacteria bacterium]MDQ7020409.1 hypothetical protein [Candidatus Dojkabacteria bacterium]
MIILFQLINSLFIIILVAIIIGILDTVSRIAIGQFTNDRIESSMRSTILSMQSLLSRGLLFIYMMGYGILKSDYSLSIAIISTFILALFGSMFGLYAARKE